MVFLLAGLMDFLRQQMALARNGMHTALPVAVAAKAGLILRIGKKREWESSQAELQDTPDRLAMAKVR